jgi:hypothetical protein
LIAPTVSCSRIANALAAPLSQNAMQDLSRRRSWHILITDEGDRSRPLVAGKSILAPFEDF